MRAARPEDVVAAVGGFVLIRGVLELVLGIVACVATAEVDVARGAATAAGWEDVAMLAVSRERGDVLSAHRADGIAPPGTGR